MCVDATRQMDSRASSFVRLQLSRSQCSVLSPKTWVSGLPRTLDLPSALITRNDGNVEGAWSITACFSQTSAASASDLSKFKAHPKDSNDACELGGFDGDRTPSSLT